MHIIVCSFKPGLPCALIPPPRENGGDTTIDSELRQEYLDQQGNEHADSKLRHIAVEWIQTPEVRVRLLWPFQVKREYKNVAERLVGLRAHRQAKVSFQGKHHSSHNLSGCISVNILIDIVNYPFKLTQIHIVGLLSYCLCFCDAFIQYVERAGVLSGTWFTVK